MRGVVNLQLTSQSAQQRWRGPIVLVQRTLLVLLLALASLLGRFASGQEYAIVEIVLPRNNSEATKNSNDMAMAVLRALDADSKFIFANMRMTGTHSASSRETDAALALVKLAAPEEITSSRSLSINGKTATRIAPVPDFLAFCDAIDYGRIVDRNVRERYVKVRIRRDELAKSKLLERARRTGRGDAMGSLMDDNDDGSDSAMSKLTAKFSEDMMGEESGLLVTDNFAAGDRVEVEISGTWYRAKVQSAPNKGRASIVIDDIPSLSASISDRRLTAKLKRVKQLTIVSPLGSLRLLSRATTNSPAITARKWNDKSGRFSITATYVGKAGETVELRKEDGRTIKVPIGKLSTLDREYVSSIASGATAGGSENPFASGPAPIKKRSRQLSVDRSSVREFDPTGLDRWQFTAPPASSQATSDPVAAVDLADLPDSERFFEKIERLDIASDGSRVLVVRRKGHFSDDSLPYLQMIDTTRGRATPLTTGPRKSKVLDSLPERALLLMRPDGFGIKSESRLFVQRLTPNGVEPVLDWKPYEEKIGRRSGKEESVDEAWFLSKNRVLTTTSAGRRITIWKLGSQAVAEYELESRDNQALHIVVGPNKRMIAIGSSGGVSVIDSENGKVVGVVRGRDGDGLKFFNLSEVDQIAFSGDLRRLAVVRHGALTTWDLETGALVSEIWHPEIRFSSSILWMGDFVLVDGKYLFDADRRVLLWVYKGGGAHGLTTRVAAKRLWYVPKAQRGVSSYLGSLPVPDDQVLATAESLGSPESLLVARPGDEVSIRVDVDPRHGSEVDVRAAVAEQLTKAGYVVVQGDTPLVAVATCKALKRQQIRINLSSSRFDPDAWDIVTRTIEPQISRVSLEFNGEEVWAEGTLATVGRTIHIEADETLDDALRRLTTADINRVLEATFASHVARAGEVGRSKAYGESYLSDSN